MVLNKLRDWAGGVGEIRIEDNTVNPVVRIQLSGVDIDGIITQAKEFDNVSNRLQKIRELVFASMDIEGLENMFHGHTFIWRGTKRSYDVLYANVRELNNQALQSQHDTWQLVVDRPFDTEGHTPSEDFDKIQQFRDTGEETRTLVWLPTFFSRKTQGELARLVIIENLLRGENLQRYSGHLSPEDRITARDLLGNQKSTLESRILQALEAAYAIRQDPGDLLDDSYDMSDRHFSSLWPAFVPQKPVGASLKAAAEHLLSQALENQFPDHPEFLREFKMGELKKVLEVATQAARTSDGRILVEKTLRPLLAQIAEPLELGKMGDTHFVLENTWRDRFERQRHAAGSEKPTVAELRDWMDQPKPRGLPTAVGNLLILIYADQTNRSFFQHGGPYPATLESLPSEVELREQDLPAEEEWLKATELAASIFGHPFSNLRNAANVTLLASKLKEDVQTYKGDCDRLPDLLKTTMAAVAMPEEQVESCDRFRTADAVRSLLASLESVEGTEAVKKLVSAEIPTSPEAMGTSLKSATRVLGALRETKWQLFEGVSKISDERKTQAETLIGDVQSALQENEYVVSVGEELLKAERRAIDLLTPSQPISPPPPPPPPPPPKGFVESGEAEGLDCGGLEGKAQELVDKMKAGPDRRIQIQWTITEEGTK